MKKIVTLLFITILMVSFYSCGKDKNTEESPTNPFLGTWALETSLENGTDTTTDCDRKSRATITSNLITINSFYVKSRDKSCQPEVVEYTYTYANGKITNIRNKKTGESEDDIVTFTLENGLLVTTVTDENVKSVEKYKKL